ncbi:STAS domain-containing protein [Amycolatopsis granulosa]|uniref:STAS domain-containing protein n=1 Tax=Amycolatopsis granulosa TaxID=185684 RepID=UPI001424554F|nr:STAS domain-containing protein [Amycolatopsis granulosa]NIH87478.1 anti-anti-sigma factor [Amycolatopsis granulosa]
MTTDEGATRSASASVVRTEISGDTGRVLLLGEIDHGAVDQLDQAVEELLGSGVVHLVLDFAGLNFFDSACISALIRAKTSAEERSGTVKLANVDRYARRILDITGLLGSFTIEGEESPSPSA